MHRRQMLKEGAVGIGLAALLGGGVWTRRAYAVHRLERQLVSQAETITATKAYAELKQLPAQAREEIRRYFLGICLDAPDFAADICSHGFTERLGACSSDEQRQLLVIASFVRHVVPPSQIMDRVGTIAANIGAQLDDNWAQCCHRISEEWGKPLARYPDSLDAYDLAHTLQPLIHRSVTHAIDTAAAATTRPALNQTGRKIGESAILLLPMISAGPHVGWPLFAFLAVEPVAEYLIGWLTRPNVRDVETIVNGQLKVLGNQIGAEFERDVSRRIADLHAWQDNALQTAARVRASEAVPWL